MMCIYNSEQHSSYKQYPLMEGNFKSYCSTIPDSQISADTRYRRLVPYQKRELFDENGISRALFRLGGFRASYLDGDFSLFSRGYIHWSRKCMFSKTDTKQSTLEQVNSKMKTVRNFFWFILFFFVVLTVLNVITLVFILKSHLVRYQHVIVGKVVLFLNYIAFVVMSRTQRIQGELNHFMSKFSEDVCSDDVTNVVLKESFRLFNKVERFQTVVFYMWKYFVYLVMGFSFLVFLPLIYRMILLKIKLVSI